MLETYALILLLGLTDQEQLLATNIETQDPVQNATEQTLIETETNDPVFFFENYEDLAG